MRKAMQILGHLLTGIVVGTLTAFLLLVIIVIFKIHDQIMKK